MANTILIERIKNRRIALDLTLGQLAGQVGLNRSQLSLIENGKRKINSQELVAIAEKLNCSVDYLCGLTAYNAGPERANVHQIIEMLIALPDEKLPQVRGYLDALIRG